MGPSTGTTQAELNSASYHKILPTSLLRMRPQPKLENMAALTAVGISLPADAAHFCARNDLLSYLEDAVRIASDSFHRLQDLKVVVEADPETGDEYAVIDVVVMGSLDSAMEQYRRYTEQWVRQAPACQQHLIRLVFDVRQDGRQEPAEA